MSSAYAYAEGGPITDEIVLARSIDRYGAQAVFGRTLSFHEVRMMTLADNIANAHYERQRSENWAEWAEKNRGKNELLVAAGKLYAAEEDE
jgi:hypothetical protein